MLFIIARSGEVLAANSLARRILSTEAGARLSELAAAGGWQRESQLIRCEPAGGESRWVVWMMPLINGAEAPSYCAVAVWDADAGSQVSAEVLASLFRLARAEVRLAQQMIAGRSPAEAADGLGVTIHTVRTYLKRLYRKTGVKSRAALVRKLLQCARLPSLPQ